MFGSVFLADLELGCKGLSGFFHRECFAVGKKSEQGGIKFLISWDWHVVVKVVDCARRFSTARGLWMSMSFCKFGAMVCERS